MTEASGQTTEDGCQMTTSIQLRTDAVGDRGFIERIKSLMGVLAIGRKSTKAEESYQLRESPVPYGAHFGAKKGDIGPENTLFWDVK
ncbi:MAG: hypothetical protein JRJ15_10760 [Deltaproteobacteria bacterium]|nr:hypothetical protein [Deltaproteobacteria bacterium]